MKNRKSYFVPLIIILNTIVFAFWKFKPVEEMVNNYALSWDLVISKKHYWVILTSIFSHKDLFHFLINMFVLQSFGIVLEKIMGHFRFLFFYLGAGIMGSLFHIFTSNYFVHAPDRLAVGASGAIAGLVLLFSLKFPKEKLLFFAIIPVPAIFGALAFIGLDIWGLMAQTQGGGLPIGHGAHLGGAFFGIIYYLKTRKQRQFLY
jgi:membrane associated rhomboid family serine protease